MLTKNPPGPDPCGSNFWKHRPEGLDDINMQESDQIVKAMNDNHIPVTYLLYADEGHGFVRPENKLSFYAVAEHFLAENLGGKSERVGDDF
jgi:dienelactone hydrolase